MLLHRRYEMIPVIFCESPDDFIISRWRRGQFRKGNLRDFHAGPQNDGDVALIADLERDVQKVAWIDDARSVVNHETHTGERRFATDLNEIVVRAEKLFRKAEHRDTRMQYELFAIRNIFLSRFGEDLSGRIDVMRRACIVFDKFVAEQDVIARRLQTRF